MKKNECFDVEITDMNFLGFGIAKVDGCVLFVSGAVTGDTARVRVIKVCRTYAVARTERILVPSKHRVEDGCAVSAACGGCAFRSVDYAYERTLKEASVRQSFVRQGLRIMSLRSNTGLRALIDKSGISEAPSAFHLGYVLGPRINACGRVGEASLGNKLLCSRDDFQAGQLADKLNEFNAQRKEIEAYVLLSAIEMLEGTPQEYPIAFAAGKDWHQGVVGIVAGKLKERYNVPAFVMSIEPDEVKGSARSVPGVDLGALIIAAKEKGLLTKGGGHTMAAGFSLSEDKIEAFRRFAGEYVRQKLGEEDVAPVIEVDSALDLLGANTDFAAALELLEPFGAGNAEPKIVLEHVRIVKPGIVGAGHVRCFLTSGNGGSLKAMAFKIADTELGKTLLNSQGAVFDIAGVLRRDNWQGRNSVQFIIDDAIRCE